MGYASVDVFQVKVRTIAEYLTEQQMYAAMTVIVVMRGLSVVVLIKYIVEIILDLVATVLDQYAVLINIVVPVVSNAAVLVQVLLLIVPLIIILVA
jgi:hypothetical protein